MQISIESLIIIVVGVASGWLAGQVMNGTGFGIFGDLIIGIIGAFVVAAATAPSPRLGDSFSDHQRHHRRDRCSVHSGHCARRTRLARGLITA
jgi:hypothetical protein